jgi:hypothetical protein
MRNTILDEQAYLGVSGVGGPGRPYFIFSYTKCLCVVATRSVSIFFSYIKCFYAVATRSVSIFFSYIKCFYAVATRRFIDLYPNHTLTS